jgi:hypothetical protein
MGAVLCFFFANTLVATMFYADDGVCEEITLETDCSAMKSSAGFDTCSWRSDNETCEYLAPVFDIITGMLVTLCVTVLSLPMDRFWSLLTDQVTFLIRVIENHNRKKNNRKQAVWPLLPENDEFHTVRTQRSTLMRAAFLVTAQKCDALSTEHESMAIRQNYDSRKQLWRDRTRYGGAYREKGGKGGVPMEQHVVEARTQTRYIYVICRMSFNTILLLYYCLLMLISYFLTVF